LSASSGPDADARPRVVRAASGAGAPPRRRLRIPLAALGPVGRRRRLGIALPLLAAAALVAGLLLGRGGEPASRAAALAPPDTALWIRVSTAHGQDEARMWEIARRFPALRVLRDDLVGPEIDPTRDIRPWLGDELALALPAAGGGPLVLAAVADRPAAERFRRRLPDATASAFAGDFLVLGPEGEVTAAVERADGDAPALADGAVYRRAAGLDRGPIELYAPADGVRRLLAQAPAVVRAVGAFADSPQFEGLAARVEPEDRGVRIHARVMRAPGAAPAQEFAPALPGRAPASAAAFLDVPGADSLVTLLERGGLSSAVNAVRTALPELAGIDLDRDVLGPLGAEASLTLTARGATPVITMAARSDDPALTREALARLQEPLADELAPGAGGFRAVDADAFSLAVTPQLEPSYAVTGNIAVASTHRSGLGQRTLARRGLAQEPALRAVADEAGGRIEALAFADLRQLLALGERTGLTIGPGFPATRDDLRQVRAAGAVVRREESDSTAELFLEIP
jgi:Protein of unknown function (DUF3352)